jgi:uncharacterized metal-binding protein
MERYAEPEIAQLAAEASRQEAAGYQPERGVPAPLLTRIEEVCQLARRMGYRRLGLAFCGGLLDEARRLDEILTAQGFEVHSVVCKVGCTDKKVLGLSRDEQIRPGGLETMCNPIAQAELLNRAGTELNLVMGLCVGHDALFFKHATAYTTVIAVKDRVLGHNPLAALYTSGSYYRKLVQPPSDDDLT